MSAYLTVEEYKKRSMMPGVDVDALDTTAPDFLPARLLALTSRLNAKLRKRYAAPFSSPVPEIVLEWLTRLMDPIAYFRRGVNPQDPQFEALKEDAKAAWDEINEAANSNEGLFDLPLREDTNETGISRGGPMCESQVSPYDFVDVEADALG